MTKSRPNILSVALPCVPYLVPLDRKAAWSGKYSCNWGSETVKAFGGPWNTLQEACDAILATRQYKFRAGTEAMPHFDRLA